MRQNHFNYSGEYNFTITNLSAQIYGEEKGKEPEAQVQLA